MKAQLNRHAFFRNPTIRIHLRLNVFKTLLRPILEYALPVLRLSSEHLLSLERLQRRAAKLILGVNSHTANEIVQGDTGLKSFTHLCNKARLRLIAHIKTYPADSLVGKVYASTTPTLARGRQVWAGSTVHSLREWMDQLRHDASALPSDETAQPQFSHLFPAKAPSDRERLIRRRAVLQRLEYRRWRNEGANKRTIALYMRHKDAPIREKYLLWLPAPLATFYFKIRGDVLPTKEMVTRGRAGGDPNCPFCGSAPETLDHLLFTCRDRTLAHERRALHRHLRADRQHAALNMDALLAAVHPRGPSVHDEVPWSPRLLRQPPIQERIVRAAWEIWRARAAALQTDDIDDTLSRAIAHLTLDNNREHASFGRLDGRRHYNSNRSNTPITNDRGGTRPHIVNCTSVSDSGLPGSRGHSFLCSSSSSSSSFPPPFSSSSSSEPPPGALGPTDQTSSV